MATLAELRSSFRNWLSATMRIDKWSANPPTNVATEVGDLLFPANTGMQAPIKDFSVTEKYPDSVVKGSVVIPFAVTYRFDKQLAYHQLPIDQAEILASSVMLSAIADAGCIHEDIQQIAVDSYDPVEVAKFEQPTTPDGKDWLMILYFPFKVFAILEPGMSGIDKPDDDDGEDGGDGTDPPYDLKRLDIGIWRSRIGKVGDQGFSALERSLILVDPTP